MASAAPEAAEPEAAEAAAEAAEAPTEGTSRGKARAEVCVEVSAEDTEVSTWEAIAMVEALKVSETAEAREREARRRRQ